MAAARLTPETSAAAADPDPDRYPHSAAHRRAIAGRVAAPYLAMTRGCWVCNDYPRNAAAIHRHGGDRSEMRPATIAHLKEVAPGMFSMDLTVPGSNSKESATAPSLCSHRYTVPVMVTLENAGGAWVVTDYVALQDGRMLD